MSVKEYPYQRVTNSQLEKCARWCLNNFQLRDWEVKLFVNDLPDIDFVDGEDIQHTYGKVVVNTNTLKAEVWINQDLIKRDSINPYSTVIHEIFHIVSLERGDDVPEQYVMVMEPLLYRLYCSDNKLKVCEEK